MAEIQGNDEVLVLAADGFDETGVVCCLARMRRAGISISVVGLSSGMITSSCGINMRPDWSMDDVIANGSTPRLVILPGGRQSKMALQVDPRVFKLLNRTIANGGYTAVMLADEPIYPGDRFANWADSSRLISQGELSVEMFAEKLIELLEMLEDAGGGTGRG